VVGVIGSTSAKSVVVSADGTMLFVLTTDGEIQVVDIQGGSPTENQVISSIGSGSSAKSVVVSADGTLLYVVQEDSDDVLVFEIEVIPGVGATNPDGASTFTVESRLAGTLHAGDDPADAAVDPSGSGRVIVANAGDATLTVFGKGFQPVQALFKILPGVIIPKLPGHLVFGLIQLPLPLSVHDIDFATVRVFDSVHVVPDQQYFGDLTFDGVEDVTVLFCRDEFLAAMPENGELVDVGVKGLVGAEDFEGMDTIHVLRPTIEKPEENERLSGGQPYTLQWTTPLDILPCDQVKIEWRTDGDDADDIDCDFHGVHEEGLTIPNEVEEADQLNEPAEVSDAGWMLIANHVPNTGSYQWNVPLSYEPNARLRITLLWFGVKVGSSEVPFRIEVPVAVRLKSMDVFVEAGAAVLRWETSVEAGMEGYRVTRAESEGGRYQEITKELIPASGSASGGSYEYRDESVTANRTYWYKLQEVAGDGLGMEFGPYSVTYRLANALEQNRPNPFNPTTTIDYAMARDGQVELSIYDVAGRRVRTLVNERQRADVYRVEWDGTNDGGQRVASGVYFYRIVAGKFTQTRKMVMLK
jgi:hypothetical protein